MVTDGPGWFERLARERGSGPLPATDPFVLEVRVGDGDDRHVHHLSAGPDGYAYAAGPAPAPDAWLTIDGRTADALRAGTVSITAAVQSGHIQVGGDLQALLAHQAALAEVAERVGQR